MITRILSKESKKNSFFDDISISKTTIEDDSSDKENIIEIHSIAIASFNTLFRQKDVKIFAISMKNLKIQLKKQKSNTMIDLKSVMSSEYHDFLNVFFKEKKNILLFHKKHDHRIKLEKKHESRQEYALLYNLSENELLLIKKYLKKHVDKDFIESSTTLYTSLILFVKKSDKELRFCVNYCKLNASRKRFDTQFLLSLK